MNAASELFTRYEHNPLLTPADWPTPVGAVFNPAAIIDSHGKTVLLCRVEDRRGLSHLWVARSDDGLRQWRIDPRPLLSPGGSPDSDGVFDKFGYEDPRAVWVDELAAWVITCTFYGPAGPGVYMAQTADFRILKHIGRISGPEDKNAVLLPRRLDGKWMLLHRPMLLHEPKSEIWMSTSPDLHRWKSAGVLLACRDGAWWDATRIGAGPPPMETPDGWLLIYHGVKQMVSGPIYRVGLALLDTDDPTVVTARSPSWVLGPTTDYERRGDAPNVVFPCGATYVPDHDELRLYYGGGDSVIAMAAAKLSAVRNYLRSCPAEP